MLVVVLVSVLLVSACSPASEEEGSGGSPGATGTLPGSPASSPSSQRALDVLGEVFTEEELDGLREVFTEEELVGLAGVLSGEELVGLFGSGSAVWESALGVRSAGGESLGRPFSRFELFERDWAEFLGLADDELRAVAFLFRTLLDVDQLGFEANDVSTPTGAFCWVLLSFRVIAPSVVPLPMWGEAVLASERHFNNWLLWMFEREAADRGLELGWETGPVGGRPLRDFLAQATDPGVRRVVFSDGLPPVLRPVAESFYDYFDRLLELEVYRVRPKVEEIADYPLLAGMSGEDIRQVWPEVLDIKLGGANYNEFWSLFNSLEEDEEVGGLLNAECERRSSGELLELACPAWVAEAVSDVCTIAGDGLQGEGAYSDCLFGCPRDESWEPRDESWEMSLPLVPQPFEGFLSVSAGLDYACGVRPSGSVWCWNWWYLGDGDRGNDGTPSFLGHAFSFVDAGWDSACGLHRDGEKLDCWQMRAPLGELEPPAGEFKEVSAGIEHACAIRANGGLACWGIDPAGAKVSPPAGEFVSVDAGWDGDVHLPEGDTLDDGGLSCGLRVDSAVECWGEQNLTYGEGSDRGDDFTGVAVGRSGQVCVLRTDGIIHCGEDRIYGSDYPQGNRFTQVSVGGLNHTCGLRANGAVECWEASGEFLGSIPGPFTELEVGYTLADVPFACGLLEDGRILCWDLIEEVFTWASEGLEKYTYPQCFIDYPEPVCWTAGADPPREIDDIFVTESPILLPHSNSVLYPDGDSN